MLWPLPCLPQEGEKEEIVPALTGVFAEALRGGVSNLSFGDLSGQLGGCWLVGWFFGWLVGWLVDWLAGWLAGWLSRTRA
jgi:hypothetical protein